MSKETNLCQVHKLGVIDYLEAAQLQDRLVSARRNDEIPDTLLLLQHPHVFTVGTSGGEKNIKMPLDTLKQEGVQVVRTDRGGNITYHGYGQLVGYPILDLTNRGKDLHQYVRNIEEVVIRTLNDFGVTAYRDPAYPGVWFERKKLCAVGIRINNWVTKHGFALNVNNTLKYFSYIYPCGIINSEVTTLSMILGYEVTIEEVIPKLLAHFSDVFQVSTIETERGICAYGWKTPGLVKAAGA